MADRFNGLAELLSREDCGSVISKFYSHYNLPKRTQLNYEQLVPENPRDEDYRKIIKDEEKYQKVEQDVKVELSVLLSEIILAQDFSYERMNDSERRQTIQSIEDMEEQKYESEYYKDYDETCNAFYGKVFDEAEINPWLQYGKALKRKYAIRIAAGSYTEGYFYTPGGKKVKYKKFSKVSTVTDNAISSVLKRYSHCTLVEKVTNGNTGYNCHNYAWLYKVKRYEKYWKKVEIASAGSLSSDRAYCRKISKPTKAGQVVLYSGGSHSAVISKGVTCSYLTEKGNYVTEPYVKSKWGLSGAVFRHPVTICDFYAGNSFEYYDLLC